MAGGIGLFSRKPAPALPDRGDLRAALDGLHPKDAERVRGKGYLAEMCTALPAAPLLALIPVVIDSPADHGLLYLNEDGVSFQGAHSGRTVLPLAAVRGAEMPFAGTLRVLFDPTAVGVHVTFKYDKTAKGPDQPEALDFTVAAKEESQNFFCAQVNAAVA